MQTGGDDGQTILITKLRRSAELAYLTEANVDRFPDQFGYHDVWDPTHLPSQPDTAPPDAIRVLNDDRHRGRVNVLFLDGHTVSMHYRELTPREFDPTWDTRPVTAAAQ